jgi:hypothetical protein
LKAEENSPKFRLKLTPSMQQALLPLLKEGLRLKHGSFTLKTQLRVMLSGRDVWLNRCLSPKPAPKVLGVKFLGAPPPSQLIKQLLAQEHKS